VDQFVCQCDVNAEVIGEFRNAHDCGHSVTLPLLRWPCAWRRGLLRLQQLLELAVYIGQGKVRLKRCLAARIAAHAVDALDQGV
jgi:hypothetical protein